MDSYPWSSFRDCTNDRSADIAVRERNSFEGASAEGRRAGDFEKFLEVLGRRHRTSNMQDRKAWDSLPSFWL